MDKNVLISTCEHSDSVTDSIWYTVVHQGESQISATDNPWNKENAITVAKGYLMDDCLISIRPAKYENRIDRKDGYNKDFYFLEISKQDASIVLSSRRIYRWEIIIKMIENFKGLSFDAATRIWRVKKY